MSEEEQLDTPVKATPPTEAAEASISSASEAPGEASTTSDEDVSELERRIAELESQLAKEHEAATDYMNRWQRTQADFSNFRRRTQQEQERMAQMATAQALGTILPALDSFERAFDSLPASMRMYSWIDGVNLVYLQLRTALQAHGIQPVELEPGQPFNPALHEAIGEIETADHPAGSVAVVIQRGYTVGEMLLRPALVQVARAPQPKAAPETNAPEAIPESGEETRDEASTS